MFFSRFRQAANQQIRIFERHRRRATRQRAVKCWLGIEGLESRTVPAFLAPVNLTTGASIVAAAVADFNGDGLKDIVEFMNDVDAKLLKRARDQRRRTDERNPGAEFCQRIDV